MTPLEREKMFRDLQAIHPQWPPRFISGYIHGVEDEDRHKHPAKTFQDSAHDLDHYALGYLVGFAMHRGPDAECEPWFHLIGLIVEEHREAQADS